MALDLINILNLSEKEKTIYFKNRILKTNKNDLAVFQILNDYFSKKENEIDNFSEAYLELNFFWMESLLYLKFIEKNESLSLIENNKNFLSFFDIILSNAAKNNIEKKDLAQLLYAFPWHLRTLLIQSESGNSFDQIRNYIKNVSNLTDLSNLKFKDISYLSLSKYDLVAIDTYADDLKLNQEEVFDLQITKNLPTSFYILENLKSIIENFEEEKNNIPKNEKHAYNIFFYIYENHFLKNKEDFKGITFYFMHVYASLCFWHFENTRLDSNFFIKEGKFNHLPRIKKMLNIFKNKNI